MLTVAGFGPDGVHRVTAQLLGACTFVFLAGLAIVSSANHSTYSASVLPFAVTDVACLWDSTMLQPVAVPSLRPHPFPP